MRHDTYTGGEHYWIIFRNGHHEVRMEGYPGQDNKTVHAGNYEDCIAWLENEKISNAEYDLGI